MTKLDALFARAKALPEARQDVIAAEIEALLDDEQIADDALEAWLRAEVPARVAALDAAPETALSADAVRAALGLKR